MITPSSWLIGIGWSNLSLPAGDAENGGPVSHRPFGSLFPESVCRDRSFAVTACPGCPDEILIPREGWTDPTQYDKAANRLAESFRENFKQYAEAATPEIAAVGPMLAPLAPATDQLREL